jgi:hypothetical protein
MSSPSVFSEVCVTRSLALCFVDRCLTFVLFLLVVVLSVLFRFTDSDNPFGIFKLFLNYLFSEYRTESAIDGNNLKRDNS